jgi:uncharacterized protein YdeI (YjbR/CyaY-like superfamily)
MTKGGANPQVDAYLSKVKTWRKEMERLRKIILACPTTEELKWGKPCYTYDGKNIVIVQGFKEYCALLFFKGVLLSDPDKILVKTGENTQVGCQIRFTELGDIVAMEAVLKTYINEAIEIEQAGVKVNVEKRSLLLPEELTAKLDRSPSLKAAFAALTPGRQRAYNFYFSAPKQSKTRSSRVEKCVPRILAGKGLTD